ncbi:hypothetical protein HZB90_02625 [archaeon]|nr:hypothetical protein [archaeon]
MLEFFDGESVRERLERGEDVAADKATTRRILLTYAKMLKKLHDRGMLFIDNNWGNVLVNGHDVAICDYDLTTRIDDPTNTDRLAAHIGYRFKEMHLLEEPTRSSDLESFALMIDRLFVGRCIIDWANLETHQQQAKCNRRSYPIRRLLKIPQHLREVVSPMIAYPRNESLTADDFIEAVKLDFS